MGTRPDTTERTLASWAAVAAAALLAACADGAPDDTAGTSGAAPGRPAAAADSGAGGRTSAGLPDERLAIPLPELRVKTPAGDTVPLRERPDEVTVINFWATWCVPCLEEIPELVALEDSIADRGGRVLGIAVDSGSPEDVRGFARKHEMDYDLAMAGHGWAREHFTVFGLPVTLVVGRDDTIRHRLVGPHDLGQFLAATRPWLERPGADGTSPAGSSAPGS